MQIVPSASGSAHPYTLAPIADALFGTLNPEDGERLDRMHNLSPEDPSKSCRTCQSKGYFTTRLTHEIATVECNCLEQWMLRRRFLHAGIGDAYQRYGWQHASGVNVEVLQTIRVYVENLQEFADTGMGLILWSPRTGTGKTLLASLVLKEAMAQGYSGHFTSFTEMMSLHTSSWTNKGDRDWFTKRITNIGFLVIDELGKENMNGNALDVVDSLIDQVTRTRIGHGRPTIIGSNLKPTRSQESPLERDQKQINLAKTSKDFSRYQQGLIDLLGEASIVVEVKGENYRPIRHEQRLQDAMQGIRYPIVVR